MATAQQIRDGWIDIARRNAPPVTNIAQVKSVNESEGTCVLIDEDEQEILDVRLKPVLTDNKSFLQIPKVGSFVIAVRIEDDDDWMVIGCDEVAKFLWIVGNTKIELTDKICMEANNQNLLKLMERLFTVLEKGYNTNAGATIKLILEPEFISIKNDFKKLLK